MDVRRPGFEVREADWLSVSEALGRVLASARPLAVERIPTDQALARALAETLSARATLPPWDNSAMDGYAVRSKEVADANRERPVRLEVSGDVRAGAVPQRRLEPGHAIRIMTGAPVPAGADAVVPVEETDAESGAPGIVEIRAAPDPGRHVRPRGQDMEEGEAVLPAGTTLTPGALAVVAALGHATVPVVRLPRVAILSTGDELRSIEDFEDVVEGRGVPEVNGPLLLAATRSCGALGVPLGIARDDESDLQRAIEAATNADLLVTSGGASMGEADLLKRALESMGFRLDFWRVRIRPGSPFGFGWLPRRGEADLPVLGLPGNPASAFVTFQLFARPAILRLAGHEHIHRRVIVATAGEDLRSTPRLTHFHRVRIEGPPAAPVVRLAGHQGSGLVQSLGRADGLAIVLEGRSVVRKGESVEVMLLDDGPGGTESAHLGGRSG
jgi:molybdopterin molybdotransferase